jgi:hypothetical protein
MPPDDDRCAFSVIDFKCALEAVCATDLARLEKIARILAAKTKGAMTPTDLLHTAVLRTLEGKRSWKQSVSLVQHLAGAMRSIAFHDKAKDPPEWHSPAADPDNDDASGAVALLVEYFEDKNDDDALLVLEGYAEGKEPKEIRDDLDLDQTRYETIMKAIRRAGERLGISKDRKTR